MAKKGQSKKIVVLYHDGCLDGFGAAWAAWKKLGNKAEYIGVKHENPPPPGLKNKEIYMLDFAYPEKIIRKIIAQNKGVTAIDHHSSRESAIKLTKDYVYSLKNSGAVLAWKYFHSKKPVPRLLKYIEDSDIWKFGLKNTKEILSFIWVLNRDFVTWGGIAGDLEDSSRRTKYVERGKILRQYEKKLIAGIIEESAQLVEFEGHKIFAINAPGNFASEIGHILYEIKPPFAAIWSKLKNGVHVSLRSNGSVDVSKIAQKFNGGGRRDTAGFSINPQIKFPWKEIA